MMDMVRQSPLDNATETFSGLGRHSRYTEPEQ